MTKETKEIGPVAFIDKKGNKIMNERLTAEAEKAGTSGKIGEAYGFFYYGGKTNQIFRALPQIRELTESPLELTLDLVEGVDNLNTGNDPALVEVVQRAKEQHMSHVLKATLPGMGNRRAANFLGNIMIGVYDKLYDESEPFNAGIAYKRGEQYVFRRD